MAKSNLIFNIRQTIPVSATTGYEFNISNDFETDQVIETTQTESIVLKNDTQLERLEITATGGVATIVRRGLTNSRDAVEDSNLNKQWNDGDIGYITQLAFDVFDAGEDITIAENKQINFEDDTTYIKRIGNDLLFKDLSNVETSLSTLTAASGADTKVSVSTNDTTTGTLEDKLIPGDGLQRVINNPGGAETRTDSIDLITTNGLKFTGSQLDINTAAEGQLGTSEKATDAEVIAGTENTKFITPAQNYIVTNGSSQTLSVSTTGTDDATSSSILLANTTIGEVNLSITEVGTRTAKLEVSDDNAIWSDLYSITAQGSFNLVFLMQKGLYYRVSVSSTASSGTQSASIKYTT